MTPKAESPSTETVLLAFAFLALVSGGTLLFVANDIRNSLPKNHAFEWAVFALSTVAGSIIGAVAVRLGRPTADRGQRGVTRWQALAFPIAGIVLLFSQFAPLILRIPVLCLLAGAGLSMLVGYWRVWQRMKSGRYGRPRG